jgi:ankyrin repeat protein
MPRQITPRSTLENLRREAKRWLKALRENLGEARARLERALPEAPKVPTLRDVQHALAREHGLPGWAALKNLLARHAPSDPAHDDLVTRFLDNACPDHHVRGAQDHVRARHTALRLLERHPEIAHASFQTEIVCGNIAGVEVALAAQTGLARLKTSEPGSVQSGSGSVGDLYKGTAPKGWEPLSYLCFTRLPLAAVTDNAVAIARMLLDHGADPNVYFMAGGSQYTPLVGAIGEGEEDRPPHPQRDALVRLLLERGANPYDIQVVYNIGFHGRVLWFLEMIYERALQLGRKADWDDPEWSMLGMGGYGSGARWHLDIAIKHNDVELAAWCLAHGANANAAPRSDKRRPKISLYEAAVRNGSHEIAELLIRYGATPTNVVLSDMETFVAACLRLDRDAARAQLAAHPDFLRAHEPIFAATEQDRADVVEFLLDLGVSPNVENAEKERPLHIAGYNNALRVAELLIARGAEIDPVETNYGNTPLGCADHYQYAAMMELLGRYSRDVWELTYIGNVERVRAVLREEPERARVVAGGHTPLMWLPTADERRAMAVAELLLAHGADPSLRNKDGMTAADRAERIGMFDVAEMLRRASSPRDARPTLERYEQMAANLLEAYRTGTAEAMQRHWNDTWHRRSWDAMRRYVQLDLGKRPAAENGDVDISADDARLLVARDHGFEHWQALVDYLAKLPPDRRMIAAMPVKLFTPGPDGAGASALSTRDWDVAIESMKERRLGGLDAKGQLTDDVLERISHLEHVTSILSGGSKALSDTGLRHLARMPQLRHLDLSGTQVTDRGLEVLRELPALESISLSWTGITDAGVAHLRNCRHLRRVDLSATNTGDDAIKALMGMSTLCHFKSGARVTDAGLPLLHQFPVFKTWQGGEISLALLSADAAPNFLLLRGSFTDRGLGALAGLDGLFALNVDDSNLQVTPAGIAPLVTLPNLGMLAFDATDEAMPYIAAMPKLRALMCQDTVAGDDGFVALSRSRSIENIWGRRCYNLRARGFTALSTMPALRALSVSCKNVDDAALSTLPRFPALRELMPMDVPDEGYRHIGRCDRLESLILMYCRDTTDAATEHITGLPALKKYFASYNLITDRTPELLSGISSLEKVEFSACAGLSNTGIAALARLPRLKEVLLDSMPKVTHEIVAAFPAHVRVDYSP